MRKLLLLIVSYGSLLLLLMPATGAGIISAVIMFLLGTCFIVYKKGHTAAFWHTKEYFLLLASIIIVIYLGHTFYNLWLPSSKMQAVANLLHMPIEAMLQIGSFVLSILAAYFLYVEFLIITKKLSTTNERNYYERALLFCMIPAIITVVLSQFMINIEIVSMGYWNFMWNMLIVASVILFSFACQEAFFHPFSLGQAYLW